MSIRHGNAAPNIQVLNYPLRINDPLCPGNEKQILASRFPPKQAKPNTIFLKQNSNKQANRRFRQDELLSTYCDDGQCFEACNECD